MKKTITLAVSLILLGLYPTFGQWNPIDDYPGDDTDGACSFFIGTKYYVGGGIGSNSFYELDTETDSWTQKADIPGGVARGWAIGFSIDGAGYIGGGDVGGFSLREDFYKYDPQADSWEEINSFGGGVRDGTYSCTFDGKAYVFGGFDGSFALNEVWTYDPLSGDWSQKNDFPGGQCIFPSGFIIGDKIYVGTGSTDGFSGNSYFYEYTPATDSWVQKADLPGVPKQACVGFAIDGQGFMGGGEADFSTVLTDFYTYHVETDSWTDMDVLDFHEGASVAWSTGGAIGQTVYMGTGANFNDGLNVSSEFYKATINNVGLDEERELGFSIYPNPSSGLISISGNEMQNGLQISIENLSGQQVYRSVEPQKMIDISQLAKGVYLLRLTDINGKETSQLFMRN